MLEIGMNIKKIRELKGFTRKYLADKLAIGLSGYAKIERGETELTISKFCKIAEILNVDFNKILKLDSSKLFNISEDEIIQGESFEDYHFNHKVPNYIEKYIAFLEKEVDRLKKIADK